MRYTVDVQGRPLAVELRETGEGGLEAVVGPGGPAAPAAVRLVGGPAPLYTLELGPERRTVWAELDPEEPGWVIVSFPGRPPLRVQAIDARAAAVARQAGSAGRGARPLKSPMPGVIVDVRAEVGAVVRKGDVLLVLEAMKMQNEIRAEADGTVERLHITRGVTVAAGARLIDFGASGAGG